MSMDPNSKEDITMETPPIVSPQEWLAARKELLAKEKELTRARDRVNADRRRLPMVRIDTPEATHIRYRVRR